MKQTGTIEWSNNYFEVIGSNYYFYVKNKTNGSVIAPCTVNKENNKTYYLLIEIVRADGNAHLEFPRGFADAIDNNRSSNTAIRELKEETGLITTKDDLTYLGLVMPDSGILNSTVKLYTGKVAGFKQVKLQDSEKIVSYQVLTLNELKQAILNNQIVDGYTIATIAKLVFRNEMNN